METDWFSRAQLEAREPGLEEGTQWIGGSFEVLPFVNSRNGLGL